jgi:hypothetical protein
MQWHFPAWASSDWAIAFATCPETINIVLSDWVYSALVSLWAFTRIRSWGWVGEGSYQSR